MTLVDYINSFLSFHGNRNMLLMLTIIKLAHQRWETCTKKSVRVKNPTQRRNVYIITRFFILMCHYMDFKFPLDISKRFIEDLFNDDQMRLKLLLGQKHKTIVRFAKKVEMNKVPLFGSLFSLF